MSKRLLFLQVIILVVFSGVLVRDVLAAVAKKNTKESYVKKLEGAFVAKILNEKEEQSSASGVSTSIVGAGKEIGVAATNDISSMLKSPFLDLLVSSELVSWGDVKNRLDAVKKALEMFEVKYALELKGGSSSEAIAPGIKESAGVTLPKQVSATLSESAPVIQVSAPAPTEVAQATLPESVLVPTEVSPVLVPTSDTSAPVATAVPVEVPVVMPPAGAGSAMPMM